MEDSREVREGASTTGSSSFQETRENPHYYHGQQNPQGMESRDVADQLTKRLLQLPPQHYQRHPYASSSTSSSPTALSPNLQDPNLHPHHYHQKDTTNKEHRFATPPSEQPQQQQQLQRPIMANMMVEQSYDDAAHAFHVESRPHMHVDMPMTDIYTSTTGNSHYPHQAPIIASTYLQQPSADPGQRHGHYQNAHSNEITAMMMTQHLSHPSFPAHYADSTPHLDLLRQQQPSSQSDQRTNTRPPLASRSQSYSYTQSSHSFAGNESRSDDLSSHSQKTSSFPSTTTPSFQHLPSSGPPRPLWPSATSVSSYPVESVQSNVDVGTHVGYFATRLSRPTSINPDSETRQAQLAQPHTQTIQSINPTSSFLASSAHNTGNGLMTTSGSASYPTSILPSLQFNNTPSASSFSASSSALNIQTQIKPSSNSTASTPPLLSPAPVSASTSSSTSAPFALPHSTASTDNNTSATSGPPSYGSTPCLENVATMARYDGATAPTMDPQTTQRPPQPNAAIHVYHGDQPSTQWVNTHSDDGHRLFPLGVSHSLQMQGHALPDDVGGSIIAYPDNTPYLRPAQDEYVPSYHHHQQQQQQHHPPHFSSVHGAVHLNPKASASLQHPQQEEPSQLSMLSSDHLLNQAHSRNSSHSTLASTNGLGAYSPQLMQWQPATTHPPNFPEYPSISPSMPFQHTEYFNQPYSAVGQWASPGDFSQAPQHYYNYWGTSDQDAQRPASVSPPNSQSPESLYGEPLTGSRALSGSQIEGTSDEVQAEKPSLAGRAKNTGNKGSSTRPAGKALKDRLASNQAASGAYVKKETRVHDGRCNFCRKPFATINLRGHPQDFDHAFDLIYYCLDCAPQALGTTMAMLEAAVGVTRTAPVLPEDPTRHVHNFSLTAPDTTIRHDAGSGTPLGMGLKLAPRGAKKRIKAISVTSPTVCDVCSRWIAHGAPIARDPRAELNFNIETVCSLCMDKYRRCSDCGGGGGLRLGVGKWRCKELFSPMRKTCDLSHARQSSVTSMEYCTARVRDIPQEEFPNLLKQCHAVFKAALYSSLAVPEILERGTAMASTFEDVEEKVVKGWQDAKNLIEEDVEFSKGFRRYIGLRWSAPRPRKVASRKLKAGDKASTPEEEDDGTPKVVLRPGMNLSGFVTGEWDILGGTFYITVSVPYTTGEQYEGSAHLIGLMAQRIMQERQDMIRNLNKQGRHAEALAIPPLLHSFTMLFFSPESKLMTYMESKRQLIPLHRYMEKHPDTDPTVFPPHRQAYVSLDEQKDWTVLVRRMLPPSPAGMMKLQHMTDSNAISAHEEQSQKIVSEKLAEAARFA